MELVLKTSDLTANASTNIGTCDQYRTTFTWNNINLRVLLGDMYDQYDYFNILLTLASSTLSNAAAGAGTAEDRQVYVKMSGLPFINQSYNQATGNNGIFTTITTISISTGTATSQQYYNNTAKVCTFNKDQDLCNITISLFRASDDTKPILTAAWPQFAFFFSIVGIDKPDNPDKINHLMRIK